MVGFRAGLSPTSFHLSPTSFHLSPRLGACGRVSGQLVSHFLSFVSHFFSACGRVPGRLVSHFLLFVSHFFSFVTNFFSFVSQAGCLWSGSRPTLAFICLPVLFIYLPEMLVVGFPARLFPTCFHLSPGSFHLSPRNASFVSQVRHCWCHVAFLFICLCHC